MRQVGSDEDSALLAGHAGRDVEGVEEEQRARRQTRLLAQLPGGRNGRIDVSWRVGAARRELPTSPRAGMTSAISALSTTL